MRRVLLLLFMALMIISLHSISHAARQAESCSGNCDATGSLPGDCWYHVHEDHEKYNNCSNYFTSSDGTISPDMHEGGEGNCNRTYLDGTEIHMVCSGDTCTVSGKLPCGGSLKPFGISCTGPNGHTPAVTAGQEGAICDEPFNIGGTFQTVECGSDGNLVYGQGSS